jgi:hypothetical protein
MLAGMYFFAYADEGEAIDRARDVLTDEHPLVLWRVRASAGEFGDVPAAHGVVQPEAEALLEAACSAPEDPFCAAMCLRLFGRHYENLDRNRWTVPDVGSMYRSLAAARASEVHPIVGLWIAEAALGLVHRLRTAYAAEMDVLAWRQGLSITAQDDFLSSFFLRALADETTRIDNVYAAAYVAPVRLALVDHLIPNLNGRYRILCLLVKAQAAAALALVDAQDQRQQGVRFHSKYCLERINEGVETFAALELAGASEDAYEMLRMKPGRVWFDGPLEEVADALLLVGENALAINMLRFQLGIHAISEDAEVKLLERVMDLTR